MAKQPRKKTTTVREHPRRVRSSKGNPERVTIVDKHIRRLPGTFLDREEIKSVVEEYDRKIVPYPTSGKLKEFKGAADKYDALIAIWTNYFNQKFNADPKLDPDVIKALIASESGFRADPPEHKIAFGITQITKKTLEILQDPKGETKEFIFNKIRQKDLKDPEIAIPMGVRWIFRKRATAQSKLGRAPTAEEIILEYKGLLKSKTTYKDSALASFRKNYAKLKSK